MFTFVGRVGSRSTVKPGIGPPGEADLLRLNPDRRARILLVTGWHDLYAGSLNLEVDASVVTALSAFTPKLIEKPNEVVYPPPYQAIPNKRGGYAYYAAHASRFGQSLPVLVRRAVANPIPTRVELFADRLLRDHLEIKDGDDVTCVVSNDDQ